ncbi:odorant receptor 4-like isoform X2 [Choristoneura fumiferana]
MHFKILQKRFQSAVNSWSVQRAEDAKRKFVEVVKRHQELIHLVDQIEILYSKSTLFNIVSSSVLICLSGFNVTSLEDMSVVFSFLAFLFMSLTQIFLLCYFGDMLMRSSMELSEAVYNTSWYQMDQSMKKNILFVLARARRPCKLTAANFADVNLRAFTTILSRSWSYFALLKTVYK